MFVCKDHNCKHNMFFEEIFKNGNHHDRQANYFTPHETVVSRSFGNCMLRLNRPLTIKEIGSMYGISFQTIARISDRLLRHVKKQLKKEDWLYA